MQNQSISFLTNLSQGEMIQIVSISLILIYLIWNLLNKK